jgi:hypothetical protein
MTAAAFPGDGQARALSDLAGDRAAAIGEFCDVAFRMPPVPVDDLTDEQAAAIGVAALAAPGEVLPGDDMATLARMDAAEAHLTAEVVDAARRLASTPAPPVRMVDTSQFGADERFHRALKVLARLVAHLDLMTGRPAEAWPEPTGRAPSMTRLTADEAWIGAGDLCARHLGYQVVVHPQTDRQRWGVLDTVGQSTGNLGRRVTVVLRREDGSSWAAVLGPDDEVVVPAACEAW